MRIRLTAIALTALMGAAAAAQQPWIDMPPIRSTTFNSSLTRGFQIQAPVAMTVVAVRVPNPNSLANQSIALFNEAAKAVAWSGSSQWTPVQTFIDVPETGQPIPLATPITVPAGNWFGVLGACHAAAGTTMNNPYAATPGIQNAGRIGGISSLPVYRLLTQGSLSTYATGPITVSSEDAGNVSLVEVYIVAHGAADSAGAQNQTPAPGTTVFYTCEAGAEAAVGQYFCALSLGNAGIPLPFGTLGLSFDDLFKLTAQNQIPTIFANGSGVLNIDGEGQAQFAIPNFPILTGVKVYSAFVTVPGLTVSATETITIT